MSNDAGWRSNADTHKMATEDLNKHGVENSIRPPGSSQKPPGGVLHQRSRLPQNPLLMAVGGFAVVAGLFYFMLYAKPKKGLSPNQVAASVVGDEPSASLQPRN